MERKQGRKCPQCDAANTRVIDGGSTLFCPACDYEEPRADWTPSPAARRTLDAVEVASRLAEEWRKAKRAQEKATRDAASIGKGPSESGAAARWCDRAWTIESAARAAGVEREFQGILSGKAVQP